MRRLNKRPTPIPHGGIQGEMAAEWYRGWWAGFFVGVANAVMLGVIVLRSGVM